MTIREIALEDLDDMPRPLRTGDQLCETDQALALALMAPDGHQDPRAWLSRAVFVVTRKGRLNRRLRRPVAQLLP